MEGTGRQKIYDNNWIEILEKILKSKLLNKNSYFWLVNKAIDSSSIFYFADDDIEQSIYSEIGQGTGSYLETIHSYLSGLKELTSERESFLENSDTRIDRDRLYSQYAVDDI